MCGIFEKHTWTKWETIEEGNLKNWVSWSNWPQVVGRYWIQKRSCSKCGELQMHKKRFYLGD